MGRNEIKALLSIVSLLALVASVVCYFSHALQASVILILFGVVCKVAEIIIRISRKKN